MVSFFAAARSSRVLGALMLMLVISAATCDSRADAFLDGQQLILQDWGVYAGKPVRQVPGPTISSGIYQLSDDEHLLLQTHEICAALGTDFGMRFRLSEAHPLPSQPITVEIRHPPLTNREGRKQALDSFPLNIVPGGLNYVGWIFLDATELVAGNWRFVMRRDGAVLLDESFTVKTSCQALISEAVLRFRGLTLVGAPGPSPFAS